VEKINQQYSHLDDPNILLDKLSNWNFNTLFQLVTNLDQTMLKIHNEKNSQIS
jgi:hypothetical protein